MAIRKTIDDMEAMEPVTEHRTAERVRIMIPSDDSDMGKGDVIVGCNGEIITIMRDQWVDVKIGHYNALMDAVKTELVLDADHKVVGTRRVPRYNVQRMG